LRLLDGPGFPARAPLVHHPVAVVIEAIAQLDLVRADQGAQIGILLVGMSVLFVEIDFEVAVTDESGIFTWGGIRNGVISDPVSKGTARHGPQGE
jgi:hypothetical protein